MVCGGVMFILMNGDVVILIECGLFLGNGFIIFVVFVVIEIVLVFIGKFEFIIME